MMAAKRMMSCGERKQVVGDTSGRAKREEWGCTYMYLWGENVFDGRVEEVVCSVGWRIDWMMCTVRLAVVLFILSSVLDR